MSKEVRYTFTNNFVGLVINQGVNILIAVIVTPILFQNLGSINYGLVELAFSIFMLISIFVSYGYHLNGPKRISLVNLINNENRLINEIISLRLFIAAIIVILFIITILNTNLFENYRLIIIFSIPILISEAIHPVFYLQGKNKLFTLSKLNALSKVIYLVLILMFIKRYSDAYRVNLFYGLSTILVYSLFWLDLLCRNKFKIIFSDLKIIKKGLLENYEFFLSSVAGHISLHSGIILLKFFVDNTELGKFALANRIAFFLRMIPVFVIQSLLQNASVIFKTNIDDLNNYLNYYYVRGLGLTFIIGITFSFFSKWIIILFSGQDIFYSSQILSILSFIPFLATLNLKNILIILVNENKTVLNKATWYSTLFTFFVAIILSNYYGGFGLALSLLISEFISFMIHSILLSSERKNR